MGKQTNKKIKENFSMFDKILKGILNIPSPNKVTTKVSSINITQNNMNKQLLKISYSNRLVLTTAQVANFYEVESKHIQDNYGNNRDKFEESKHYFLLKGKHLELFKKSHSEIFGVPNSHQIRSLYLWTERGCLLHAKSINSTKAWEVYEFLIENYFRKLQVYHQYLLEMPAIWRKTYPDEFFIQVMKTYGFPYDPEKDGNTPQFVGKFINEYVYQALHPKLPKELKAKQKKIKNEEELDVLMHQFFSEDGKEILDTHLTKIITILQISENINQFKTHWAKLQNPNQTVLELG
jgi:hypothetical protein